MTREGTARNSSPGGKRAEPSIAQLVLRYMTYAELTDAVVVELVWRSELRRLSTRELVRLYSLLDRRQTEAYERLERGYELCVALLAEASQTADQGRRD